MKKIAVLFILVIITMSAMTQTSVKPIINLQNKDIVGRWIETEKIMADNPARDNTPAIFVFKEDSTYHKGAEIDDMIIFAIAGRYTVKNDSIYVTYFDFSGRHTGSQRQQKMWMKILSYSTDEMRVMIRESRYNKYEATLRRQN